MSNHQTLEEKVNATRNSEVETGSQSIANEDAAKRARRVRIIRVGLLIVFLIAAFALWRILRAS